LQNAQICALNIGGRAVDLLMKTIRNSFENLLLNLLKILNYEKVIWIIDGISHGRRIYDHFHGSKPWITYCSDES